MTNNATRSPAPIAAQLAGLGVPASAADVVTSAQAAARLLAERLPAGAPVLVIGGTGLRLALRERGCGRSPPRPSTRRPSCRATRRTSATPCSPRPPWPWAGALYVATNADATLPSPRGPQPGNGSIIALLVAATGVQPVVAGKPEPPLHAESVQRTGARRPLVVGDRLDTDIEGAVRGRADSLLVLTGVSTPADAVLRRRARPTYLARDLGGLLTPHPESSRRTAGSLRRLDGPHARGPAGTGRRRGAHRRAARAVPPPAWVGAG